MEDLRSELDVEVIARRLLRRRDMIAPKIGLPALAAAALFMRAGLARAEDLPAGMPRPKIHRMYDGADGVTHWDLVEFDYAPGEGVRNLNLHIDDANAPAGKNRPGLVTLFHEKAEVSIAAVGPGEPSEFHHGGRPELVCVVQGVMEHAMRDGTSFRLHAGDFLWALDQGKGGGHTTRCVGPEWALIVAMLM